MFGIGGTEFLVIIVVAILVLGPEHLPRIMRTFTKVMSDFRRVSTDFQRTINLEANQEEWRQQQTRTKKTAKKKKKAAPPPDEGAAEEASHGAAAAEDAADSAQSAAAADAPDGFTGAPPVERDSGPGHESQGANSAAPAVKDDQAKEGA